MKRGLTTAVPAVTVTGAMAGAGTAMVPVDLIVPGAGGELIDEVALLKAGVPGAVGAGDVITLACC